MQDFKERLKLVKDSQNKLTKEYQSLLEEYESNDLVNENEVLRRQYAEYKQRDAVLQDKLKKLETENGKLREALTEQILDEKLGLIKASKEKMEAYFASQAHGHMNRLDSLEHSAKLRISSLYDQADKHLGQDKEVVQAKLGQFQEEMNHRMADHRRQLQEEQQRISADLGQSYDQLTNEGVSEETIQRRIKQNQIEMKIGLNWINRLGILLIILGVGAAFKYSYSNWFSGYMKGGAFFLLGLLMLAGGEWLFRKKKQTFALGLLGGGISVLYGSVFYSYFLLEIIELSVGLILSVLITAAAVLLSLRYQSRTICSIALIGGYLPLFSYMAAFGLEGSAVYVAMGYLLLLNASILLISLRKRWVIVHYISFVLNTYSMMTLVWIAGSAPVSILYVIVTFMMYLGITLSVPFRYATKLSWWDFSLLALNTVISCGVLYGLFGSAGWEDFQGLLAFVFCAVYLGIARFTHIRLPQEMEARLLFYGTSLTFGILMIPIQFGHEWVSLGWLIEGIVLTGYGHLYRSKQVERVGWGIIGLCLGSFIMFDALLSWVGGGDRFNWKYSYVSIGILIVTIFYAIRHRLQDTMKQYRPAELQIITVLKYIALINIWFYLLYEAGKAYELVMPADHGLYDFYSTLLSAAITLGLAFTLTRVSILYDTFIKYYSLSLYVISYLLCIAVTLSIPTLDADYSQNTVANYIALGILIGFNIFVFFSGRALLSSVIRQHMNNMEWYPVIIAIYLFSTITVFLGIQFHLGHIELLFSIVYLLLSIGYIMYGFRYRYILIRRVGLGLSLLSTGKMLLFDLNLMTAGSKIVAYFSFGIVLLGISYIYQRVSSRMKQQDHEKGQDSVESS
ncbi:hypothetical protein FHR92_001129 [Fontibacillus solani]|uniref:DUF2339 domain-containing protein n=1 Tax=Fontibacillus solani TaxID=1572857 RepID=A0A7W3SRE4_9BACL|nr:DUF2339 domain-containing protein [Fontibacillus solani]MBA9084668.1 hypothetical protein [Fontibacillus solani]